MFKKLKVIYFIPFLLLFLSGLAFAKKSLPNDYLAIYRMGDINKKFAKIVNLPLKEANNFLGFASSYSERDIIDDKFQIPEEIIYSFKSGKEFRNSFILAKKFIKEESYQKLFAYAAREADFFASKSNDPIEKEKLQAIADGFDISEKKRISSEEHKKKANILFKFANDKKLLESFENYLQKKFGYAYKVIALDEDLSYVELQKFIKLNNMDIS